MCRPVGLEKSHLPGNHREKRHMWTPCGKASRWRNGQEKQGCPPDRWKLLKGSKNVDSGGHTGHPSLAGIKGRIGKSNEGEENGNPIYDQYQGTIWGHATAIWPNPEKSLWPDLTLEEDSLNLSWLTTTQHVMPSAWGRIRKCGHMASAVGIRRISRGQGPAESSRQLLGLAGGGGKAWFWKHCWNYKALIRLLDHPLTSNECPWGGR